MRKIIAAVAATFLCATPVLAQSDFPNQPVRIVVGFAPGGGMDTIARMLGEKLAGPLGQQVIVDNRPGAGGTIAAAYAANERPDGYTLYLSETSALIGPVIYDNVGYDPITSFVPVAHLTTAPMALVANPSLEAGNMAEFIELAKAKPGEYFYATPGVATVQHLGVEMLAAAAGIELEDAPFQGGAPSVAAVVSGEVPLAITSLNAAVAQAQGGKVKILGITSSERLPDFPDLPAISETVTGFAASPSQFLMAPANTPAEVVEKLSKAVEESMNNPELVKAFSAQGFIPNYKSGTDLAAELPATTAQWTEAAKALDKTN